MLFMVRHLLQELLAKRIMEINGRIDEQVRGRMELFFFKLLFCQGKPFRRQVAVLLVRAQATFPLLKIVKQKLKTEFQKG